MSILDEEIKKNIIDYNLLMCSLECYLDNAPKDMGVDLKIKDAIIYLLQFYAYCLKNNETEQLENIKIVINKICDNEYLFKNLKGISTLSELNRNDNLTLDNISGVIQELQTNYFSYKELMVFFGNCANEYLRDHKKFIRQFQSFKPSDAYQLVWALNCHVTIPGNIPNHAYIAPELISAIIHMFKIYNDILNNLSKDNKNNIMTLISIIKDTFIKICKNKNLNYFKEIEDLCSENNKIQINTGQINQEQIDEIIKNLSQYLRPIKYVVYLTQDCLNKCRAEEQKRLEEVKRLEEERKRLEEAPIKLARQKEKEKRAENLSKIKVLKELTLINAWNAISTNNKLDSKKIKPEKLTEIANALKDPEIHTFNNENNIYIIPDGQFDELIKNIKENMIMGQVGLTQEDINRHKKERTDFKAKNSKIFSYRLSTLWKRGGIKTRKYKKGKKGNKYKSKKHRKNNKTKKCKSNKYKSKKRNYK